MAVTEPDLSIVNVDQSLADCCSSLAQLFKPEDIALALTRRTVRHLRDLGYSRQDIAKQVDLVAQNYRPGP